MIIELLDLKCNCGRHPFLDTWDENASRSIKCFSCERKTKSYFMRSFAYMEWRTKEDEK